MIDEEINQQIRMSMLKTEMYDLICHSGKFDDITMNELASVLLRFLIEWNEDERKQLIINESERS